MDFPTNAPFISIANVHGRYDDLRIYSGIVTKSHIHAIAKCGRSQTCVNRAYAKPQSRRTYCVVPNIGFSATDFIPPCATGLFYTGAVIDLRTTNAEKGVTFSFRDTSLDEIGYEVLRREKIKTLGKQPTRHD